MSWFARLIALAALGAATRAGAQDTAQTIQVAGPARERATILLRRALAGPHDIMAADSVSQVILPRGTELPRTVVILGGDASVGATVRGDVIVVGGDLFLRPGASIDGQAVAIGGGVYGSTLASVRGGTESLRDHTFDIAQHTEVTRLDYRYIGSREPGFELPLLEGLRIPTYDRVNGASVPWGPVLRPTARWIVDPTITYRSHSGEWDAGVNALFQLGERYTLTIDGRRSTFTNETWIYSDLINSFNSLVGGSDTRNYYRADRGEVTIRRYDEYVEPRLALERFIGVSSERAWSVGSPDTLGSRPWSFAGRYDVNKLARTNPAIEPGRISSVFVGGVARYQLGDVRITGTGRIEVPIETPGDERFAQATFDASIAFPTFGVQRFRSDLHVVATVGDTTPPQRFAYLGGTGTLPVIEDPLSLGGDQLLQLDSRYEIPIPRVAVPFLGSLTVSLRHRIGSAGVQGLPRFVQNLGPVMSLGFVRVDYVIDPATNEGRFAVGLSFAR
jgi:hypothetical protein